MAFELPSLPYAKDALEPFMSAETFDYHYGKHHKAYVDKLNAGVKGTEFEGMSLEEVVQKSSGGIFNNAAQHWNHSFFWKCMQPKGGGEPGGALGAAIDRDFGSFDDFKSKFNATATSQFGSGWAWLVSKDGKLDIMSTANADTPLAHGVTPLFTVDVWEHAYYIDYRNRRGDFVDAIIENLANWEFASENLKKA